MMMTAIGLMSGTSLDGVDIALIETDGKRVAAFGPTGYRPYTEHERGLLRDALAEAVNLTRRDARPGVIGEAERIVTTAHAEAVAAFIEKNRITREDIDIVGFHGQTVLHRPAQRLTVQIGDAAVLAKAIHVPVMHDFRAADVAAGGHGAPFVPVYHRALAQSLNREGPICVVNIGGVANGSAVFARLSREAPAGRRVLANITSGAARSVYEGWSIYGASKAAVDHLTEIVAAEEPDLVCHAVAPGVVDTDMQALIRTHDEVDFPAIARFRELHEEGAWNSPAWIADHLVALLAGTLRPDEVVYRVPNQPT